MPLFEPVFAALNGAGSRYVVVGGLAVVLHGHPRLTADVDIILDLEPVSAKKAMEALKKIGLQARAPVDPAAFADARQRESWIADKGMTVFSLYSPSSPLLSVDLFVRAPIPFEKLWSRSKTIDLGGTKIQVASIDDLIAMKRAVARPQDLLDVEALEALKKRAPGGTLDA
ncbi:MAG: nucleotidyl transferase AbiEii/AbiGii toxin family protein [Elusimicrobia bacterium]|nr:nucleotidyl transferase AbiEii/AbiGii toxin family protein [Elusimicrobiota bacterium]